MLILGFCISISDNKFYFSLVKCLVFVSTNNPLLNNTLSDLNIGSVLHYIYIYIYI